MLKQYLHIKSQYQDCILFFRLGDFYEMFYQDAQQAANLLDLVLTSRGSDDGGKIPMCGIPYHAAENYIAKLVKAGLKVAICEQVEDPASVKGIVRREVIRVISAGTLIDDSLETRFVAAISLAHKSHTFGIALTDTATGMIYAYETSALVYILEILSKFVVTELIFSEDQKEALDALLQHPLFKIRQMTTTRFQAHAFDATRTYRRLCDHFQVSSLRGFGLEEKVMAYTAAGALLEYLESMHKTSLKHIDRLSWYEDSDYVFLSPAAYYGLELEQLLKTIDMTQTPMGKRLFRFWLYHPLKKVLDIQHRQRSLLLLRQEKDIAQHLKEHLLKNIPDVEKSLSRLSCGVSLPRDLLVIRNVLERLPSFKKILDALAKEHDFFDCEDIQHLREKLLLAINPDMPLAKNEGKVIREGFNPALDELRSLKENGLEWLKAFQMREVKRTGISSLKIGFNRVFGYYIEITSANLKLVPSDYIRKQTLANGERYITEELKAYEEKILSAETRILKIEAELMEQLTEDILKEIEALHRYASKIALWDVLVSLVALSYRHGYVLAQITEGYDLIIEEGRHPVVETLLAQEFIANDMYLNCDDQHLMILTGPNMAGKSTYIRQNALLVMMAQMGSFVPAKKMIVGIVDKIFTRIGAHDDISKGQSTFMVEMNETADILNNLSKRSLVILDEIGRGTSTTDGLSLAWALAEYLAQQQVRTLFATHFHELIVLAEQFKGIKNFNVAVKEWGDQIIFLHKIIPGGSDDSYGIYVAKLAGIPLEIIHRAKSVLTTLETESRLEQRLKTTEKKGLQLEMSDMKKEESKASVQSLYQELIQLQVDHLTPLQALQKISEWKKLCQ